MKLKKITLLIFTAVFVSISCSSETEAGRAQKAFEKKDYGRVLKITGVPPLDDFKNWGSENYKFGSKARDPQKNNAELADENILLSQKNKKIELMLLSMQKVKDIRLSDYIAAWYEYFAITDIHIRFASYLRNTTDDTIIVIPAQTGNMIDFRLSCYKRLWTDAYRLLENNFVKTETTVFCLDRAPAFLIDATNSIIYGTSNRIEYASLLSNEANRINNKTTAFLFSFCSGKIYDKSGSEYRAQALEQFHYAMNSAQTPAHYDYALWYYLTLNKKNSLRDALDSTREYASTWFDSTWYDDFLDDISKTMLENQLWDTYYSMYTFILPYASDVINSKYAYIAGRLIQEQLIIHSKTTDNAIEQAFQTAWHSSDGQLYYRLMAADKLHISSKQILQELTHKNENWNIKADKNTIKTIENLFKTQNFESIHYIYTVQKFHVPTKKALGFAKKLSHISGKKLNWYPEALRISVQALLAANQPVSIEQLSMTYPRYYKTFVSEYALKHKIPEYYLYALIRSESFFDAGITSHANAIGLTQLIDTTAADMARKLKLKDYDITNPHDNIQIGSYYLQELYGRLDNSYIQAFFSYNGGITRVRRWKKQWENLPNDLFLEVLPYAETREYGRKIASAAAMYGVLYYDKSTSEILNEFFK